MRLAHHQHPPPHMSPSFSPSQTTRPTDSAPQTGRMQTAYAHSAAAHKIPPEDNQRHMARGRRRSPGHPQLVRTPTSHEAVVETMVGPSPHGVGNVLAAINFLRYCLALHKGGTRLSPLQAYRMRPRGEALPTPRPQPCAGTVTPNRCLDIHTPSTQDHVDPIIRATSG